MCLQVVKCSFESGSHFFFLLSSTPPFSSEEDSEGHSVQQTSHQPPQVPSRMGPQPKDDWDWSDTETSEGSTPFPGKGSGGLASSGEWSVTTRVTNVSFCNKKKIVKIVASQLILRRRVTVLKGN